MSAKRKVRARKMWNGDGVDFVTPEKCVGDKPVFVLPADAESYDAIVEQLCVAINGPYLKWRPRHARELYGETARAALAALGIHRPPTKEKK